MERRFQFGLKNLLWAMTWLAVWLGAVAVTAKLHEFASNPADLEIVMLTAVLVIVHWYLLIGAPFAAIGAIRDKMTKGLLVGAIVAFILGFIYLAAIPTVH